MKNRVLVLGCFGYSNNQLDGQTIKTRSIYELILLKINGRAEIDLFDTQSLRESKLTIFILLWKVLKCNKLVYLPAHNNLKYLFPILYVLSWLKRSEILYFVVGGWLAQYLNSKRVHVAFLSKIRAILTESNDLSHSLIKQYNFKNVITFHNFRIHSFTPAFVKNSDFFRIVYMARINKMKGIDYVFRLADYFTEMSITGKPVIIDFYGPVEKQDEEYFFEQLKKYKLISYKGLLQTEKIYSTLSSYDLMVLPTRYFTEGFPGSILDAYIAGIPVVATKWKHATDFIVHEKTGFIVPFENSELDFIAAVLKIHQDNRLLTEMKHNAYEQSKKYSSEGAWDILVNNNLEDFFV